MDRGSTLQSRPQPGTIVLDHPISDRITPFNPRGYRAFADEEFRLQNIHGVRRYGRTVVTSDDLILSIGENNREIFYIEQSLEKFGFPGEFRVARRFDEVRCYLQGVGIYHQRQFHRLPSLVILDLSLPEALKIISWIKTNHDNSLPIIGIGSKKVREPVQEAFDFGMNAFVAREEGYETLAEFVLNLEFLVKKDLKAEDFKKLAPILAAVMFNPSYRLSPA